MEASEEEPTGNDERLAAHGEDDLHGAPAAQAELAAAVQGVGELCDEKGREPEDGGGGDEVRDGFDVGQCVPRVGEVEG